MGLQDLARDEKSKKQVEVKGSPKCKHVVLLHLITFLTSKLHTSCRLLSNLSDYLYLTYLASAHPLFGDHILPSPISPRAR